MKVNLKYQSFILTPLSRSCKQSNSIFQDLERLPVRKDLADTTKALLLDLLQRSQGEKRYPQQHSMQYIKEGIETMFGVMSTNASITSAPREVEDRVRFYQTITNGFQRIGESLQEQYRSGKIEKKDLYSCLEVIGDGGHSCAGRWRQVLEELLPSMQVWKTTALPKELEKHDSFKEQIKTLFYKARMIECNRAAEEFVAKYYPVVSISDKLHYTTFFKRFANEILGYRLPITMEEDSYLNRSQNALFHNAQNFLEEKNIDHAIVDRCVSLLEDAIMSNENVYNLVINETKRMYVSKDMHQKYEDVVEYLSQEIFCGFSKEIKKEAVFQILLDKGFLEIDPEELGVGAFIRRMIKANHLDALEDCITKLTADHWKEQNVKSILNETNRDGMTALHLAVKNRKINLVNALLQLGADPNIANAKGNTPLVTALDDRQNDMAKVLIQHGADPTVKDMQGMTALMWVAYYGYKDILMQMIDKVPSLNSRDKKGYTALMMACEAGHKEIVSELIQHGANMNIRDNSGATALHWSLQDNQTDIALELISRGANLNAKDKDGNTPLMWTVYNKNEIVAKELIIQNANLEEKDSIGNTALMYAAQTGLLEVMKLMIQKGANIETRNSFGNTALLHAAMNGRTEIIKELIRKGVNLDVKNNGGFTALQLAKNKNYKNIVRLIEESRRSKIVQTMLKQKVDPRKGMFQPMSI